MDYSTPSRYLSKASDKSKSRISSNRGVFVKAIYVCQDKPSPFHLEKLFSLDIIGLYLKSFPKVHELKIWS